MQNSRERGEDGLVREAHKRIIYICNGCSEFTSDNRRSVRAHYGRSKSCKKHFEEEYKGTDRFYSTIQVRLGPQDHQAGGQSLKHSQGQRSIFPQSQIDNDDGSLQTQFDVQVPIIQEQGSLFLFIKCICSAK